MGLHELKKFVVLIFCPINALTTWVSQFVVAVHALGLALAALTTNPGPGRFSESFHGGQESFVAGLSPNHFCQLAFAPGAIGGRVDDVSFFMSIF